MEHGHKMYHFVDKSSSKRMEYNKERLDNIPDHSGIILTRFSDVSKNAQKSSKNGHDQYDFDFDANACILGKKNLL